MEQTLFLTGIEATASAFDLGPGDCVMTGSASRKPRLVSGVEGRIEKKDISLLGSPALCTGSFTSGGGFAHERK